MDEHRFPCSQCGSDYNYDPESGHLVCPHCNHSERVKTDPWLGSAIRELDLREALSANLPEHEIEEFRTLQCKSCGAQIEFDEKDHAKNCPYCASPVVTETGMHRHIKPKAVLPFALSEKDARASMTRWLGSLWFAPNGLREYARKGRKLDGIYVPFWTFDAQTETDYSGQRGDVFFVTKGHGKNQRQEMRVKWTNVRGRVRRFFDDVLVLASKSLPKHYTDALAPWDLAALEPYQPEYLAGFRSEGYTVELKEGFDEGREIMNAIIARDVRFDIGGDRQQITHLDTKVGGLTFKHILLPIWIAAYKYRGKTYRFVVNGRTGRVQGERPYSAMKIFFAVLTGLLIAAFIGYMFAINQQGYRI